MNNRCWKLKAFRANSYLWLILAVQHLTGESRLFWCDADSVISEVTQESPIPDFRCMYACALTAMPPVGRAKVRAACDLPAPAGTTVLEAVTWLAGIKKLSRSASETEQETLGLEK